MKRTLLLLSLVVALPAVAQVRVQVNVPVPTVPLPTITFVAPPPLVTVQPGIQVVEDQDDEIFFVDSWYWLRRDNRWYRTRDHRGGWVYVDGPGVHPSLVRLTPGHYRRYKHGKKVVVNPPGPHNAVVVPGPPGTHGAVKVKVKKGHH